MCEEIEEKRIIKNGNYVQKVFSPFPAFTYTFSKYKRICTHTINTSIPILYSAALYPLQFLEANMQHTYITKQHLILLHFSYTYFSQFKCVDFRPDVDILVLVFTVSTSNAILLMKYFITFMGTASAQHKFEE